MSNYYDKAFLSNQHVAWPMTGRIGDLYLGQSYLPTPPWVVIRELPEKAKRLELFGCYLLPVMEVE